MKIRLNNQEVEVPDGMSVRGLLLHLQHDPSRVGVWINGEQIWQKDYETRCIASGDKVTVVKPLAGGS